jgi:hypothetical protein
MGGQILTCFLESFCYQSKMMYLDMYFLEKNAGLQVLSDENQGGSKVVSIAISFFTV